MDADAAVIHAVALLHEFADMLLWCHAPRLQLQIRERQRADRTLRSHTVQRQVLNIDVADLQVSLMRMWRLPELLQRPGSTDASGVSSSIRSIDLATRLARHSHENWNNAALPDDIKPLGTQTLV
jgi:hypothetical protein